MTQLKERTEVREVDERVLEGLRVPDDTRELTPEGVEPHRAARSTRWLPWLLLVVVFGAVVAAMFVALSDDGTEAVRDVDGSFQVVESARFEAIEAGATVTVPQATTWPPEALTAQAETTVPDTALWPPQAATVEVTHGPNSDLAPLWE